MGILEVVQEERRSWLERKLLKQADDELNESQTSSGQTTPAASAASALLNGRSGITAQLLSKPNSRIQPRSYTQRPATQVPPKPGAAGIIRRIPLEECCYAETWSPFRNATVRPALLVCGSKRRRSG
ncbi:hypothetical protein LB505_005267 [Fusarium chuoi]|nr:hypothetical protein LB505_005267 [Fusarium chuoi]